MADNRDFDEQIKKINKRIWLFNIFAWFFVGSGLVILVVGLRFLFDDGDAFNEVGDFVGGVAGSLWALAGLFFIYIAFLGQKIEIKYQQEDLALNRKELRKTKKVFKKQTQIMSSQQLDNTFFNLLDNHRKIVASLEQGIRSYNNTGLVGLKELKDSKLEIVSGYDVIRQVYSGVFWYLENYSNYLDTNKVYDSNITNNNPLQIINQQEIIKILFNDISKIINFIDERIGNKKDIQFYKEVLTSNLTAEEKFLIEAYNVNFNKNNPKYKLDTYETYNFENFILDKFIPNRFLNVKGNYKSKNNKNETRISLDNKNNYSVISIFYIQTNTKTIHLLNEYKEFNDEIFISEILLKIKNEHVSDDEIEKLQGSTMPLDILIKTTDVYKNTKIFYQYNFEFYPQHLDFNENFVRRDFTIIEDWIKDYFIQ